MANAVSAARRRTVRAHLQEEDEEEDDEEEEEEDEVWRVLFVDEAEASGSKARSDALCRRCESIRGPVELCDRAGNQALATPASRLVQAPN